MPMERLEADLHWGGHLDEGMWRSMVEQCKLVSIDGVLMGRVLCEPRALHHWRRLHSRVLACDLT